MKKCEHIWSEGSCKLCSLVCVHNYDEGTCTECSYKCDHIYNKDRCTICQIAKYYLVGYINKETVGFNENFQSLGQYAVESGSITINVKHDSYFFVKTSDNNNWYMASEDATGMFTLLENTKRGNAGEMICIPGGVTAEFSVYEGKNDTLGFIYTIDHCIHRMHTVDGVCLACEEIVDHTYDHGVCTGCMSLKPSQEMYLFGIINGEEYGYNNDAMNIGEYAFKDNSLKVKFDKDSFVGIKTKDNFDWYMTNGKIAEGTPYTILSNTRDYIDADLFFIPGGTEVLITISNNGNDTFTISYEYTDTPNCTLKLKFAELVTDNDFRYKVSFTVSGEENIDADNMGLLIFDSNVAEPTAENATKVINGAAVNGKYFLVETDSVKVQNLVDTLYFSVYAKLSDGTYVYSNVVSYSAVRYADSVINSKYSTAEEKARMVSLLNFIAAAQKYHGYKTENLANAGITK